MRRLMQTIIALPSSAATRSSKCFTRSSATKARRFSEPTSASTLAHLRLSRSCSLCGLVLGQFAISASILGFSSSSSSIRASRLS